MFHLFAYFFHEKSRKYIKPRTYIDVLDETKKMYTNTEYFHTRIDIQLINYGRKNYFLNFLNY